MDMDADVKIQTEQVNVTPAAAQAVLDMIAQRNLKGYALRVFISGSGCSGYSCGLALDNNVHETDIVHEENGIKVVVDDVSFNYLQGAKVDYVESETGTGFKITDLKPIASNCSCGDSSSCGCGGEDCNN